MSSKLYLKIKSRPSPIDLGLDIPNLDVPGFNVVVEPTQQDSIGEDTAKSIASDYCNYSKNFDLSIYSNDNGVSSVILHDRDLNTTTLLDDDQLSEFCTKYRLIKCEKSLYLV